MSEIEPEGPVEPVEPAASEPAWAPSLEEYQALQQQVEQLAQYVQPQQPQWQPQQQGPPRPDPWERPETFQDDLDAYIEAKTAFVGQLQQEMVQVQGREEAMGMLDKIANDVGPFDKDMAYTLARQMVVSGQAPAPQSDREAQQVLAEAAKQVRDYERRVGEAYHQQQLEQIQGLSGVRREPGQSGQAGAASQLISVNGPGDETAVLQKYFRS